MGNLRETDCLGILPTCIEFLICASLCLFTPPDRLKLIRHTGRQQDISQQCACRDGSSVSLTGWITSHVVHSGMVSLRCEDSGACGDILSQGSISSRTHRGTIFVEQPSFCHTHCTCMVFLCCWKTLTGLTLCLQSEASSTMATAADILWCPYTYVTSVDLVACAIVCSVDALPTLAELMRFLFRVCLLVL